MSKLSAMIIISLCLICSSLFLSNEQLSAQVEKNDDYGKLILQIVDPETNKPVNEVFELCFFNWNYRDEDFKTKMVCHYETDNKGYFEKDFPVQAGGMIAGPKDRESSKYVWDAHPFYENMAEKYKDIFSFPVTIEKGKITRITKKAIIGGTLKVSLVDQEGNQIDPDITFKIKGSDLSVRCDKKDLYEDYLCQGLDKGQAVFHGVFPAEDYEVELDFHRKIGYEKQKKTNIEVKAKEVTEVVFVIDTNNITGMHGFVTDNLGQPLKNVQLDFLYEDDSIGRWFECLTDDNGYYRMTALPEGICQVTLYYKYRYYFEYANKIIEKMNKNILLKKDFVLPISE